MSFTWQGGRQLAAVTKDGTTTSYTYNENGLRTAKTTGTETINYYYSGDVLTGLETSSYSLYFHYDENGGIIGYTKHTTAADTEYFYVKNLQGDVLQVIDSTGTTAAQYSYDAWGNILSATGTEAAINPIRYRGYYFDTETGLYYVSSRYYDAEICRWISTDSVDEIGANNDFNSFNTLVYCGNSPVFRSDEEGECWHVLAGAAIGFVIGAVTSVVKDLQNQDSVDIKAALVAGAFGAVGGAITAIGLPNAGLSMAVGAALGGTSEVADQLVRYHEINNVNSILISAAAGAVGGAFSGNGAMQDLHNDAFYDSQMKMLGKAIRSGKPIPAAIKYTMSQTATIIDRASVQAMKMVGLSSGIAYSFNKAVSSCVE